MTSMNLNPRANKFTWLAMAVAILIVAVARLLPHPFNFTPVGALALFCGATLTNRKWGWVLPLGGLFFSDLLMEVIHPGTGFYQGILSVYFSFFLVIMLGFLIRNNRKPVMVAGASLAGSILFYLITNFNYWYGGSMYPMNIGGLIESYVQAIPFFRNMLAGDLFFNAIFFGGYYLAGRSLHIFQKVKA